MELLTIIALLISGFTLLILGGDALVKSAISIASKFKLSPATIGLTLVAAGTSAPEIATSFMASLKGTHDIAIGNIVGSNLFNILAIIGLTALIKKNSVDQDILKFHLPVLVLFTFIFVGTLFNQSISLWEGLLFYPLLITFFILTIRRSHQSSKEDQETLETLKTSLHDIGYLIFGISGLLIGAQMALKGGIQLGEAMGLSGRVIGLTIISVGTGLPEMATSMVATVRGRSDLAIANVIGSNIINTIGVPAISILTGPLFIDKSMARQDSYILIFFTLLLYAMLIINKGTVGRKSGFLLLASYITYLYCLI